MADEIATSRDPRSSAPPRISRDSWSVQRSAKTGMRGLVARVRLYGVTWGVLLLLLAIAVARSGANGSSTEHALVNGLARHGLVADTGDIHLLDDDALGEALVVARHPNETSRDIYAVRFLRGLHTNLLWVGAPYNLTHSAASDDHELAISSGLALFANTTRGTNDSPSHSLTLLDTRGYAPSIFREWPKSARWQQSITNLQETGRTTGYAESRITLPQSIATGAVSIAQHPEGLAARVNEDFVYVGLHGSGVRVRAPEGSAIEPVVPGVPGGITWVVDTVRNLSFVGPKPIEWLENKVFAVKDWLHRTRYAWFGGNTHSEVVQEMANVVNNTSGEDAPVLAAQAAEVGFPPAPMQPVIREDTLAGEGQWIAIRNDPFVAEYPNAPPAFAQSFVRADPERPYAPVYVVLWDTRQVQLHIASGVREPESATGERGHGYIPRDANTTRRLVGAFDGGFQSMHGEFGMMAEGKIFLPPKPWAATVAVFRDGRVGMGSWPSPNWTARYYDEALANRQIPPDMIEMRQNLTSVVEDGRYNPWERWWWGAAPQDADEQTYTYRSGLCLTQEGHMAFFWGTTMGADALGAAMLAARCVRGMHLDMNSGHTGFEFFRPYMAGAEAAAASALRDTFGATLPPVEAVASDHQFDGAFPEAASLRMRARKAIPSMAMRFPRYLAHDPRDFFYLTLKPVLPGPDLAMASQSLSFSTDTLPHAGWPYPFARALGEGVAAVRIDLHRVQVGASASTGGDSGVAAPILGTFAQVGSGAFGLCQDPQTLRFAILPAQAHCLLRGTPVTSATRRALFLDEDGFAVYVESTSPLDLGDRMAFDLGDNAFAFVQNERAATISGQPCERGLVPLFANPRPSSEVLYPDNTPTPYRTWNYLQGQRVRYFPTSPPRFQRPES